MSDDWKDAAFRLASQSYNDAVAPAAKHVGAALETGGKLVNALLDPLRGVLWAYDAFRANLIADVRESLERRHATDLRPPPLRIAGPAASGYFTASEEPEVRELFAELLAASMDDRTADDVHPAFLTAIQSMTADEARILRWVYEHGGLVYTTLRIYSDESDRPDELPWFGQCLAAGGVERRELFGRCIDNLRRLEFLEGVNVDNRSHPQAKWIREAIRDERLKQELNATKLRKSNFGYAGLVLTELGESFCRLCIGNVVAEGETDDEQGTGDA